MTNESIRLIFNEENKIVNYDEALIIAENENLDLIEISSNVSPPVYKIMDIGKHLFDKKKKEAEHKKAQKKKQLKEIKFRPQTDIGDYNTKMKKIISFLKSGHKVKVTVMFKGRQMRNTDSGIELLKKIENDLINNGKVDQMPKEDGRQMSMLISKA